MVARTNGVRIRPGAKFGMIEMVVVRKIMIMGRTWILFAYIICKESVTEEMIVHSRIMLCHLERWNCASSTLWIVVQNETSASICITIFLANSSTQV